MTNWSDDWDKIVADNLEDQPETWDFEKNKILIGVLVDKRENVGPNESMLYTFEEKKTNKRVQVWGSAVIDMRLKTVVTGEEIGIEYLGTVKNDKTGRTYKNYEIYKHKPSSATTSPETNDVEVDVLADEIGL